LAGFQVVETLLKDSDGLPKGGEIGFKTRDGLDLRGRF
jgi:hypothetical protein